MKRIFSLILIVFFSLNLSACNTIYSNFREIEQLLVIQSLGLDRTEDGVVASLAAASDAAGTGPRQMSATGGTINAAIDRAYDRSYEEEIFFSHVNHILIGQDTALESLSPFLDYICQSPELRVDIPLYIVRDATAKQAIMELGTDKVGVSEIMQAAHEAFATPSGSRVFTVADIVGSLEKNGCALICAISCLPSAETGQAQSSSPDKESGSEEEQSSQGDSSSQELIAAPAGYAIIREGKLCKFLEQEKALALGLMLRSVPISPVILHDNQGKPCTIEVESGSVELEPVWSEKAQLIGLNIRARLSAAIQETGSSHTGSAAYIDHLTARLESTVSQQLRELLESSMQLKADFLGLAGMVERHSPDKYRSLGQSFTELLPGLELQISVSARIQHTNNMKEI